MSELGTASMSTTSVRRRLGRSVVRGTGELLVTAGLVILLFVVYELWFTGFYTAGEQRRLTQRLEQSWRGPHPAAVRPIPSPRVGSGFAVLRIPALGKGWKFVVIEGIGTEQLKKGPGHYPDTALPGEVGNFAVAGHRTTYLAPFYNLDRLRTGDRIYVETAANWFVYRVQDIPGTPAKSRQIVSPSAVNVVYPVPHQPDEARAATLRVLTLTTCNPRYSAAQRLIVHALLDITRPRSLGPPPELAG